MARTVTHRSMLAMATLLFSITACQTGPVNQAGPTGQPQTAPAATLPKGDEGLTFIETSCGRCHGVEKTDLSPLTQAPTFAAIANRDGLTQVSLATWLKEAHNYPEMMDFDLHPERADAIAEYMMTLRQDDYRPAQ